MARALRETGFYTQDRADRVASRLLGAASKELVTFDEFLLQWRSQLYRNQYELNRRIHGMVEIFSEGVHMVEELKQQGNDNWLIHPTHPRLAQWELGIVVLLVVTLVTLPLTMAFDTLNRAFFVPNLVIDAIFMLDIAKTFVTGCLENDMIIMDFRSNACKYLRGSFVPDLVSSFPTDATMFLVGVTDETQGAVRSAKIIKLFRLLRLTRIFRLLRVSRAVKYARRLVFAVEERAGIHIHPASGKLARLFFVFLLCAHWMACVSWLVVDAFGTRTTSWIAQAGLRGRPVFVKYSWSVFKALTTMLLLELGENTRTSTRCVEYTVSCTVEQWLALVCMWVGAVFYGLLVGTMAEVVSSTNIAGRRYQDKLQAVVEYMRVNELPSDIQDRVLDFFYEQYAAGKLFEDDVLAPLSPSIKSEVLLAKYRKGGLMLVPIVQDAGLGFQLSLVKHLKDSFLFADDTLFVEQAVGEHMYLLASGVVAITSRFAKRADGSGGACVAVAGDGCFFGEVSLLLGVKRTGGAEAVTSSRLFVVSKSALHALLEDFPVASQRIYKVARDRAHRMLNLNPNFASPDCDLAAVDREDMRTRIFVQGRDRRSQRKGATPETGFLEEGHHDVAHLRGRLQDMIMSNTRDLGRQTRSHLEQQPSTTLIPMNRFRQRKRIRRKSEIIPRIRATFPQQQGQWHFTHITSKL